MKFRLLLSLIMLAVAAAVMVSAPGESQALNPNHQCSFCHSMHNSPGGMLNTAAQFDLVCDTCHGPAGTQKFVDRHVDPNNVPATWDLGCNTCHTPHSDLPNRYNFPPYVTITGDLHPHTDSSDAGGDVAGVNIKLMGRDEDGTGIAKVRTPLRILSEGSAGPCTNSNTEIEVALPPFADGDGPPHTVMVGDRISFSNAGTDFTGSYRVKETNWDNWPSQGWVCFDHPNAPVTTSGGGYLHSGGWGDKPLVATGSWNGGSATLFISGDHGIEIDDWITVMGVTPVGYNGRYQATAATPNSVTYVVADPGGTGSGGEIEFVGSVKEIQGAAIQGPPPLPPFTVTNATWVAQGGGRAVLTFDRTHPFSVDDTVTVTGIVSANNPAGTDNQGYNGTFVINQIPDNLSIRYGLSTNPGTYTSGGEVPDNTGGGGNVLVLTLNTDTNDATILDIRPATGGTRDGDIVTLHGVDPIDYDGRYEVEAVDPAVNPPTITLRCPPYLRTALLVPFCDIGLLPAYVGGGVVQSSGSMRAVVFESRGTDNTDANFLSDWTHSFTNTDNNGDGWMDGPCETCHTLTSNHKNDDYGNTHNNGRTCTDGCHWHSIGFDKGQDFCPAGRTCPPIN